MVEIDGESHLYRQERDSLRDRFMQGLGLIVLRIPVRRVTLELDEVIEEILYAARTQASRR